MENALYAEIDRLKSENASLKDRLDRQWWELKFYKELYQEAMQGLAELEKECRKEAEHEHNG